MWFGCGLAVLIVGLFAIAFVVEGRRTTAIESWCGVRGFTRLDQRSEGSTALPRRAVGSFRDGSTSQWGTVMSGCVSHLTVVVAEADWRFGPRRRHWCTLAVVEVPGAEFPELVVDRSNERLQGLSRILGLLLAPLTYLASRTTVPWERHELPPVEFPEDPEFARVFDAFGEGAAVRQFLTVDVRKALVATSCRGRLVTSGDLVASRQDGTIWPSRADRLLSLTGVIEQIAP